MTLVMSASLFAFLLPPRDSFFLKLFDYSNCLLRLLVKQILKRRSQRVLLLLQAFLAPPFLLQLFEFPQLLLLVLLTLLLYRGLTQLG